jgi:aldehyde:ferredoxin oxidoreductase
MSEERSAYKNRIAVIDLGRKEVRTQEVGRETLRKFIGGSGLAGRLFIEELDRDMEALSENNILYIMNGPLTGTRFPGTGRFTAAAKSPLTGIWGESNCGGDFGPELKFSGYDGIVVKGASRDPVYLHIEDENVEIRDAKDLWGKNVFEVVEFFKSGFPGKRRARLLTIGPAGENRVTFASVINGKGDALGRTGLGAVFGSKRLKAIAVRGAGKAWKPQPGTDYDQFLKSLWKKLRENPFTATLHRLGTNAGMVTGRAAGDIPAKNWSLGESNEYAKPLLPYHMIERYFVRNHACYACTVACKKEVVVREGPFKSDEGPAPEYETFASFGTMLLIRDIDAIIELHQACNRYGMDVISAGSTVAFAIECFEQGLIDQGDTDGMELKWGDANIVLALLEKIAYRRGFGELLADGSRLAAARIGKASDALTVEVKGLEMPMHDPRAFHGHGLSYVTSNRGACHMQHLVHLIETNNTKHPELGLQTKYERHGYEGKAEMTVICDDFGCIMNSAPMCQFVFGGLTADDLTHMLEMATGFDYDLQEVKRCGETMWYLKRIINNILGVRAQHDRLPRKVMAPLSEGGTKGTIPDMEKMLHEYYQLRELDENGIPRPKKLRELGLFDLINEKHRHALGIDE